MPNAARSYSGAMCRLFGLTAGRTRVSATFWLLGAADSLSVQSERNPDGTGLGTYDEQGEPLLERQPIAAHDDADFAREARDRRSSTFLGHVRYATTGETHVRNCHPFLIDGRFHAHNGVIRDVHRLEEHLGEAMRDVHGDTDSERYAALVAAETRRRDGDVTAGITAAAAWVSDHLPVYSINLLVTSASELWALRQGDTHPLLLLDRREPTHDRAMDHRSSGDGIRVRSSHLAAAPSVVVATEAMDDDPGWTPLRPGELLHVDADLGLTRDLVLPDPPRHQLSRGDLDPNDASSQDRR